MKNIGILMTMIFNDNIFKNINIFLECIQIIMVLFNYFRHSQCYTFVIQLNRSIISIKTKKLIFYIKPIYNFGICRLVIDIQFTLSEYIFNTNKKVYQSHPFPPPHKFLGLPMAISKGQ